jgi:hypothetical protein
LGKPTSDEDRRTTERAYARCKSAVGNSGCGTVYEEEESMLEDMSELSEEELFRRIDEVKAASAVPSLPSMEIHQILEEARPLGDELARRYPAARWPVKPPGGQRQ